MATQTLCGALRADYALFCSWREVAQQPRWRGIPAGTLCRIAAGDYEPRDVKRRLRLGLPALAEAPVCPLHGIVHARCCRLPQSSSDPALLAHVQNTAVPFLIKGAHNVRNA